MTADEVLNSLDSALGDKLQQKNEFRGERTYKISPLHLREIAKFCRDNLSFDYLLDITSIDNFGEEPRFEIVYHLYSMPHALHVRLKLKLSEEIGAVDTVSDIWPTADWHEREIYDITSIDNFGEEPRFEIVYHLYSMPHALHVRLKLKLSEEIGAVDTVSDIWPTADWHEREIYDMMGIKFNGHPDLRRILMWDGYPFFPLRKDFPLAGLPSDMPDVAFTKVTPLEGGPFVTVPSTAGSKDREPRARPREL